MNKPYLRKQTGTWYVWHNGKQVRLSKDEKEAYEKWHKLNSGQREVGADQPIANLIDDFLQWTKRNKAEKTYTWYRDYLESFKAHIGNMPISKVRAYHVEAWIEDGYADSSDTSKNGMIRCISRVFNWADKRQVTEGVKNPTRGMERPPAEARQVYIDAKDWQRLMDHVDADDPIRDLLVVLRETGCRPEEARKVEARHVDRANGVWHFKPREAKGKKYERTVTLTAAAKAISERLMLKYPKGPLFRNKRGNPWDASALTHRFNKFSERLKFEITPYAIRHTYITDALINGVDPVTLASLVGHRTLDMIHRTYQKLNKRADYMKKSAERAVRA